jgi:sugar-phosphatase
VAQNEIRAVLFDLDGVIIESREVIEEAWRAAALHHAGTRLSDEDIHEHVHGRPGSHTVATLFPDHTPQQRKEIWAHVDRIEETAPYRAVPGVREFIAWLGTTGVPIGLVTSSWAEKIEHVVELFELGEVFSAVVSRDDVANGKPHPEPYRSGCALLGVEPASTLVFEDALSGVRSSVSAGTHCVGIGGDDLVRAGAAVAVPDFTHLSRVAGAFTAGDLEVVLRP